MLEIDLAAYSIKEFSQRLGISELLTRKLIAEGQVRRIKLNRRVLIPKSELERLLHPEAA